MALNERWSRSLVHVHGNTYGGKGFQKMKLEEPWSLIRIFFYIFFFSSGFNAQSAVKVKPILSTDNLRLWSLLIAHVFSF